MYLVVGLLAVGESAAFLGLVLPGEGAMALGGVAAGVGHADLSAMLATAVVGSIVGDGLGYAIGRAGGTRMRSHRLGRWLGEANWRRADDLVARRGSVAIFLGRWVGLLRAIVPAVAGAVRMPFGRFSLWNALGAATWASTVVLVGFFAGNSWEYVVSWVGTGATVVVAVVVLGAGGYVARRAHERRRAQAAGRYPSGRVRVS